MTQLLVELDETMATKLREAGAEGDQLVPRVRSLLELALARLDEAALLGLLEGRTSALLERLQDDVHYLEALLDRVLFYAVASYALVRAPHDTEEARRLFLTSYEDARRDAERRALRNVSRIPESC